MNDLSEGTSKPLRYEDIVVKAFKLFPEDFALRGYPVYPDSSDIHKPLYGPLKRAGFVLAGNKQFRLTQKGLERARALTYVGRDKREKYGERLTRDKEKELFRIYETEAFRLFVENRKEGILDTDFYAYLGVTVRTDRNEFLGRLNTVEDAVETASRISNDPRSEKARDMHRFLMAQFSKIITGIRKVK